MPKKRKFWFVLNFRQNPTEMGPIMERLFDTRENADVKFVVGNGKNKEVGKN